MNDDQRTELIVTDVVQAIENGRIPLLLTERTDHLQLFVERLSRRVPNVFVMKGGMGKEQRDAFALQIKAVPEDQQRVIIATGRYIGEGFDDWRFESSRGHQTIRVKAARVEVTLAEETPAKLGTLTDAT